MEFEKMYLFNPFAISKATEKEIADTYTNLMESLVKEQDNLYQMSHDVEIYSNLCFLCGEMIARIQEQCDLIKVDKDIKENQALYGFRDEWVKQNEERPPAISYFESKAKQVVKDKYEELAHYNARLYRFKKAYESLENKMNAIKKKMEAIKYEGV